MEETNEHVRQLVGHPPPVTVSDFNTRLWSLNPVGNQQDTYINVCAAVKAKRTFDNKPVTLDLLVEKYGAYIQQCRRQSTQPKYITQIKNYVIKNMFNDQYDARNHSIDRRFNLK